MLHPSYTELIEKINQHAEEAGFEKVNSQLQCWGHGFM